MRRFALVEHDWSLRQRLVIDHLLGEYHWTAVDGQYVLLLGRINVHKVLDLDQHPQVLLMPSVFSSKPIFTHAAERDKSAFCLPLSTCLALDEQHTALHLAERAHDLYGRIFALDV